ncbi:putative membrane protein YngA [Paenibacillus baekrokdamisoli]|uniref:Putative membrane protein YngA n=1 Tax=Paenibacillus baekrokdamisoli TaxID=1712516 RepID=A0A3G9J7A9_9BACL|nr:GtrA family protein [Paenibacillus baekrokdamisoli]MBB3069904.1 putative flippase GtrA [Paenibacillus baekrokdamisoli]BBH20743.1 putative membrane protein YngA [Paenibacillus baekrokdamisoli]
MMRVTKLAGLVPMLKFGSVGLINTVVDIAVFTLLTTLGVTAIVAQVISYSCGVLNSYYMNRSWTFQKKKQVRGQWLKFLVVNLISLAVITVLLSLLHEHTELPLFFCKLIATAFSVVLNYIGSRYWAFGSRANNKPNMLQE